jgi:hypothetical protein
MAQSNRRHAFRVTPNICLSLLIFGCLDPEQQNMMTSHEVLITVQNECICKITFYDSDSNFYLSEDFDCNYTDIISVYLPTGSYKVIADNLINSKKEMIFIKSNYPQSLDIEF